MFERLRGLLPPYFLEKFEGVDERQLDALPVHIRSTLIHGTKEEFTQSLDDLRARERLRGKVLLGEAAMELIGDMRAILQEAE